MEYKGRKIGFKRTVGAIAELSKLAPDGKIERLGEVFNAENLGATLEGSAQFLAIMNKWYEKSLVFTEEGYTPDPIPVEWFLMLDGEEFETLLNEAMNQMGLDDQTTVDAVEVKGKKNE